MVAQTQANVPFDLGNLDINSIDLAALEEVHAYSGYTLQDIVKLADAIQSTPGGMLALPPTDVVVMLYLIGVGSDPTYTIEQARRLNLGQINALNNAPVPPRLQQMPPAAQRRSNVPQAPSRRNQPVNVAPARAPRPRNRAVQPSELSVVPPLNQDDLDALASEAE